MVNYCENRLDVESDGSHDGNEQLKKIVPTLQSDEECLSFNKVVPCPFKVKRTRKEWADIYKRRKECYEKYVTGGYFITLAIDMALREYPDVDFEDCKDEYVWRIKHWGTRSDALLPTLMGSGLPEVLTYLFDTAWTPPVPIVWALSKDFPKLVFTLKFEEPRFKFYGTYKSVNGKTVISETNKMTRKTHPHFFLND